MDHRDSVSRSDLYTWSLFVFLWSPFRDGKHPDDDTTSTSTWGRPLVPLLKRKPSNGRVGVPGGGLRWWLEMESGWSFFGSLGTPGRISHLNGTAPGFLKDSSIAIGIGMAAELMLNVDWFAAHHLFIYIQDNFI